MCNIILTVREISAHFFVNKEFADIAYSDLFSTSFAIQLDPLPSNVGWICIYERGGYHFRRNCGGNPYWFIAPPAKNFLLTGHLSLSLLCRSSGAHIGKACLIKLLVVNKELNLSLSVNRFVMVVYFDTLVIPMAKEAISGWVKKRVTCLL